MSSLLYLKRAHLEVHHSVLDHYSSAAEASFAKDSRGGLKAIEGPGGEGAAVIAYSKTVNIKGSAKGGLEYPAVRLFWTGSTKVYHLVI
jgi:hypothetical protein